jgi:thioredoxin reductase (NADPH)
VTEVLGNDGKVSGVRLRDTVTGDESTLDVTGVFVAIGHDPRSDMFKGQIRLDDEGYVLVDSPSTRTSIPGVFAAGDVRHRSVKRVNSAIGEGAVAVQLVHQYLSELPE